MTSESSDLPERGRLFSPLLEAAVRLASRGHYNQFRKSAGALQEAAPNSSLPKRVPYVAHLMGTMCILARVGVRDEVLAAAILHDYLEDVPDPNGREAIRSVVGDEVLDLVLEVTEHKRRGMDQSATWDLRKREQIEHVAVMPRDAVLIKGADVLHNLQSLITDLEMTDDPDTVWGAFNADVDRQLWYFANVARAIAERLGDHPIQRALDTSIDRLRSLTDRQADAGLSRGRDRGP